MSNSTMIKITNSDQAKTITNFGIALAADEVAYIALHRAIIKQGSSGLITAIAVVKQDGTTQEFGIGNGANNVARVQMGNLSRAGVFYTVLDSE